MPLILVSFLSLLAFSANADHLKSHRTNDGLDVNYSMPQNINVGEFFTITFAFNKQKPKTSIDRMAFKAFMPSHKHGLNYQPKITKTSDQSFKVEYLNFHMPGHWKVQLNAIIENKKYPFEFDFNIL